MQCRPHYFEGAPWWCPPVFCSAPSARARLRAAAGWCSRAGACRKLCRAPVAPVQLAVNKLPARWCGPTAHRSHGQWRRGGHVPRGPGRPRSAYLMQVDGSPSVLHSCHRVWWLMWLPPCRRTGVDPAEAARATWGWQHGSWPVSMSNSASDAVSRAGARMTAWCSGPPSAPTELGKNDGEECRRPGRRGGTRASGHEGPPRAHGEDGCAGIAARPVLRGRDPPVRMRCTRCRWYAVSVYWESRWACRRWCGEEVKASWG